MSATITPHHARRKPQMMTMGLQVTLDGVPVGHPPREIKGVPIPGGDPRYARAVAVIVDEELWSAIDRIEARVDQELRRPVGL